MRARTFRPSSSCLNASLWFSGVRSPSAQAPVDLPACRFGRVAWGAASTDTSVSCPFAGNDVRMATRSSLTLLGYRFYNCPLFERGPSCRSRPGGRWSLLRAGRPRHHRTHTDVRPALGPRDSPGPSGHTGPAGRHGTYVRSGTMAEHVTTGRPSKALRKVLVPLALAQFICSFAGSNMNVMINDMSKDLDTTVQGIQVAITIFLLVMAAQMIPGGKLTHQYGRKRCCMVGLVVYAIGALLSAASPGLGVLILGNSLFEGVGTGLLIGGLITTAISWRAAFVFQALIIAVIVLLSRKLEDPVPADPTRRFDVFGAVLSGVGLGLLVAGGLVLTWFFLLMRSEERQGKEPLLSLSLFRNRTSNLALVTQNTQWLLLMGMSFTVSAYLQVVRGYNAIATGVIFT